MEQTVRIVVRFLTFTSLTTFKSCESRDNEIVTDLLTTPNTLRENSHGCHGIVNTLRDSVVTIVTDRIVTVCFDPCCHRRNLLHHLRVDLKKRFILLETYDDIIHLRELASDRKYWSNIFKLMF